MAEAARDSWAERMVGDVVAEDYRRAAVFQRYGIDFCCGGNRSVRSACETADVAYETVAESLEAADRIGERDDAERPAEWSLERLIDHIVAEHHGYVRATLPVLRQFTGKVAKVHGGRRGELVEIRELFEELAREMESHLAEEEDVVFPKIAALSSVDGADQVGNVADAVVPLEDDHDRAGALMARIRELSDGFTPPEDACNTYRATYAKLAEFEADLHRHVHLENNILFPRAAELEGSPVDAGAEA